MRIVPMDLVSLDSSHLSLIKHTFATSGAKARPVRMDVNGRAGRRAICVVYHDGLRYEVLDMDAEMAEEDDEEDEGEGTGNGMEEGEGEES
jgi:anaphase-promoting complex subunit 4